MKYEQPIMEIMNLDVEVIVTTSLTGNKTGNPEGIECPW